MYKNVKLVFGWAKENWCTNYFNLASVVQRVDNAIQRINHYLVVSFTNSYPLDSDLSSG